MTAAKKDTRQSVLEMNDAHLVFNNGAGVFGLDFKVPAGTILGFIGPSGSGKTTTMRLLTGIFRPTRGSVRVFGKDPATFSPADKSRIGYLPQHFILYQNLTVEENLNFVGGMYGSFPQDHRQRLDELLELFELSKARKRLGRHLSGGMKRRLMLAGALLHSPTLLFADEPTAGIDPILRDRIWDYFRTYRDQGHSLMVTTQYVGEAAYCDKVAVLRRGKLIILDTPGGLRRAAMGGDIIHLQVDDDQYFQVMECLSQLEQVSKVEQMDGNKNHMLVYVNEAGAVIPVLLEVLRENLGVTPRMVEPYLPPFDEVFVRLLKKAEQ
jgi:ABC-2 type transport system ATP-binding protein